IYFVDSTGIKWRAVNQNFVDENGEYYVWVKDADLEAKAFLEQTTFTDTATGIKVEGMLPSDAVLTVTRLTSEDVGLDTDLYPVDEDYLLYDISLTLNGQDYQPEDLVSIVFPEDLCNFASGIYYVAYHILDDGTVEIIGPYGYISGDLRITVASLSYFTLSIAENTVNLNELYGNNQTEEPVLYDTPVNAYFADESTVLYTDCYGLVSSATLTDAKGQPIELRGYVLYDNNTTDDTSDDHLIYFYAYYGDDETLKEASQNYFFVHEDEITFVAPSEDETVPTTITDSSTGISVNGDLPANTVLDIDFSAALPESWDTYNYPVGSNVRVFDITLSVNGAEYQPESPVTISIPKDTLALGGLKGVAIYHVHEGVPSIIGPVVYYGNNFNLTVDGFSEFIFTDLFTKGTDAGWKGFLNKDFVTFYNDVFPGSESYTMENAYNYEVMGDTYFEDELGNKWLMLDDGVYDTAGEKYIFVRSEDVRLTYLDGAYFDLRPTENFTQVASVTTADAVQSVVAANSRAATFRTFSAPIMSLATDANPDPDGNGLVIDKDVSGPVNGVYTVTLEAYVTGNVTVTRSSIPTDIVLVLDQSGSMDDNMGAYEYTSINNSYAYRYYDSSSLVYALDNGEYYPVTVTRHTEDDPHVKLTGTNSTIRNTNGTKYALDEYGEYRVLNIQRQWNNRIYDYSYTYSYTDSRGNTVSETSDGSNGAPP
ncbi:MAG: hypothetical protein IJB44_07260, partial [Clostridia bacterium]|nr:hypothetical protein [Clostridia bacterium]